MFAWIQKLTTRQSSRQIRRLNDSIFIQKALYVFLSQGKKYFVAKACIMQPKLLK